MLRYSRRQFVALSGTIALLPTSGCSDLFESDELTRDQTRAFKKYEDAFQLYRQGNEWIELGYSDFESEDYTEAYDDFTISAEEFDKAGKRLTEIVELMEDSWSEDARNIVETVSKATSDGMDSAELCVEYIRKVIEDSKKRKHLELIKDEYHEYSQNNPEIPTPSDFKDAIRG